jgi:dihydroneopterin aldolase/D-erythro-7,8-dihydroneopterin triphosphate epimerase
MTEDEILIRDLKFRCIVGVNDEERRAVQDVVANIVLHVDLRRAGRTDNLADTIDYKALKMSILEMAERSQFHLVEALAQSIADICLKEDRVQCVTVTVEKPTALRFARTVGVKIIRGRGES